MLRPGLLRLLPRRLCSNPAWCSVGELNRRNECTRDASRVGLFAGKRGLEAVKESRTAGGTACATTATSIFPKVGQAVPPGGSACRFLVWGIPLQLLAPRVPLEHCVQSFRGQYTTSQRKR